MSTPESPWQAWYSHTALPTPDGPLCLAFDGPLARVLINRPEVRNAMSEAMWDLLLQHVQAIAAAPHIKAVVLEGAGTQAFCAVSGPGRQTPCAPARESRPSLGRQNCCLCRQTRPVGL